MSNARGSQRGPADVVDAPLSPEAEEAFAEERSGPMRIRVLFIVVISFLIWAQQYFLYEKDIFPSASASRVYRGIEAFVCLGLVAFLWKKRRPWQVEWVSTAGFAVLALAHSWSILVVFESCVVPFTLTAEWGQMVIVLASLLSFRPTLVLLLVTWAAGSLATSIRAHWDTDFSDHLILLGIYAVLLLSVRAFDRLRRREFVARVLLDQANSELRRADEVRARLFVNLSHDFRTPLALIHAEAELLAGDPSVESRAAALARVRSQTMSLADLTNQLLELARLEAGKTPKVPEDFDVRGVAEEIASQFRGGAAKAIVRVVGEGEHGDAPTGVSADPRHVRRILANLVANAVRHVPAGGGEVVLSVGRDGDGIVIDVVDDGEGIDPARRGAIFERFASFDATGSVASGIGLPVARELAELNGGSLDLLADAPKTTFRLRLPVAAGAFASTPRVRAAVPLGPSSASTARPLSSGPPRSLVIVEDHPEMRRLLDGLLGGRFRTRLAASCAQAREELRGERPSAILCDILLPDGAGYEVLEWVRRQRHLDGVPLLFLSALGEPEQRARGVAAGADDYVAKPFSSAELIARLESACARAEERKHALETQRLELVAELHDGVTASLSRAALLLAGAEAHEAPSEVLTHAREAVKEGLAEARAIMTLMDEGAVTWDRVVDDLTADIETGADAFSIRADVSAENDGSARLLSAVEHHTIRRIAREALTNAIKHGHAGTVRCVLAIRAGEAALRVEDDGDGAVRGDGTGRGIAIARRRVERLGGRFSFEKPARGGTAVLATLPLSFRGELGAPRPAASATVQ